MATWSDPRVPLPIAYEEQALERTHVDGKPLFQRSYLLTPSTASSVTATLGFTIDNMVDIVAVGKLAGGTGWVGMPYTSAGSDIQPDYLSVYDTTGGQNVTAATTLNLDTTQKTRGGRFTLASDEVTCTVENTMALISGEVSADADTTKNCTMAVWLERDTGGGYAEVAGTRCYPYANSSTTGKGTAAFTTIIELDANDKVRIRMDKEDGVANPVTVADGSRLTLVAMHGTPAKVYSATIIWIPPTIKWLTVASSSSSDDLSSVFDEILVHLTYTKPDS